MPEPLPIDPDQMTYEIATVIPDTLEIVAQHVETPEPTAERYAELVGLALSGGYLATMAAWRVAAGLAKVAGMTPAQVRELADLIGIQGTEPS